MSQIFGRLYRLLRSELNAFVEKRTEYRLEEEQPPPDEPVEEDPSESQSAGQRQRYRQEGRGQSRRTTTGQRSQPQRDPVLTRHYANLEVPYGSDAQTVKAAWRKLMRRYHPDMHQGIAREQETATRLTQELTRSYRYLMRYLANNPPPR